MERAGTPVTITTTGTAQALTTTVGIVNRITWRQHPNNAGAIAWGDYTLSLNLITPASSTGVLGWLPPPSAEVPAPMEQWPPFAYATAPLANTIYVAGTSGDVVLWSYVE